MNYPIDSDWVYSSPYAPPSGFIENRGNIILPTLTSLSVVNNIVTVTRTSGLLFLSLANRDPNISNLVIPPLDANKRWIPTKYFIGRYTASLGNFVLRSGTIDFNRVVLPLHLGGSNLPDVISFQSLRIVSSPIPEMEAWSERDPLAITKLTLTTPNDVTYIAYGLNIKWSFDLSPEAYLKYEWF